MKNHAFCYHDDNKKSDPRKDRFNFLKLNYLLRIAACAAAKRATGTRYGEQDT